MKKPKTNKNLTINGYGQLIQWKDEPEIVNGVEMKFHNIIGSHISNNTRFTIAKNELRGL